MSVDCHHQLDSVDRHHQRNLQKVYIIYIINMIFSSLLHLQDQ